MDIYDFGLERFGPATAERYAAMIKAKAAALIDFPMMGPEVPQPPETAAALHG